MKKLIIACTLVFTFIVSKCYSQIPSNSYTIAPTVSGKPHIVSGKISLNTSQQINKIYIEDNTIGGDTPDSRIYADFKNTNNAGTVSQRFTLANEGFLEIGYLGSQYGTYGTTLNSIYGNFSTLQARGGSKGLILRADSPYFGSTDGIIKFLVGYGQYGGLERMRIDAFGNVGIGTSAPVSKLDVSGGNIRVQSGDIYVTDASKGIILKSPNGTCWRVTIDDTGNFNRNVVSCPL